MEKVLILFIGIVLMVACGPDKKEKAVAETATQILTEAQSILNQAYIAHGGDLYQQGSFAFTFRDKQYTFKNNGDQYVYTRTQTSGDTTTIDILDNGQLSRTINSKEVLLSDKERDSYTESVNSVVYFATLPYKLLDPAVNLELVGETSIKGQRYDILLVTFDQENGGKDFDDQYHYWINKADHTIDYLAYNYTVNNGGVRFRSAYNRRVVDGIIFQDFINYKADVGTPLVDLPALFEKGDLKELSRIETEQVISID